MPHAANTPESLLPRSDSRNPSTTCRGITTQGRPCRRALAALQIPLLTAQLQKGDKKHMMPDQSAFYCWQHKDQAVSSTQQDQHDPIKSRTSIDTLMDRLGVVEIKDERPAYPNANQRRRTDHRDFSEKRRPRPKSAFCCFEIVDDSGDEKPSRPTPRPTQSQPLHRSSLALQTTYDGYRRPASSARPQYARLPSGQRTASIPQTPVRPSTSKSRKSSTSSQTQSLLSWIPSTLSPETASALLAELAKPISAADEEGYIYMFWVTPQSTTRKNKTQPPVPREIASSILPPIPPKTTKIDASGTPRPQPQPRSISDAIRAAQDINALSTSPTATTLGTIRLKIGRTSNVHRRLTEWTRQCSHDLTLIRYYPYTPSGTTPPPARTAPAGRDRRSSRDAISALNLAAGRKVPHIHRVERLIHLELADLRARDLGRCGQCGKEHREWFEVEAAKEALRMVDECVRRWVQWGESIG